MKILKDTQKKSIDLLDNLKGKNIFRVYPSNFFCNKKIKKCFSHDNEFIYYSDGLHLSYADSKVINEMILSTIESLEP